MGKKYDVACYGIMVSDVLIKGVRDDIMNYASDVTESISICTGGDALNEALTCARLGLKTALVGNLGDDFFGDYVLRSLEKDGVHTEGVVLGTDCSTAVNIVLVGNEGKRSILTTNGTNVHNMQLSPAGEQVIRDAGIVCIGSLFDNASLTAELVQRIYKAAAEGGALTVADASIADAEGKADDIFACLRGLDYFLPSYSEGRVITGLTEPEAIAEKLLEYVNKAVVLKLGEEGCLVCSKEEGTFRVPAFRVDAIDTTGAGDNFVAGFLWGLSRGVSLQEICKGAAAVGAISTTKVGANGAVTSAAQVMEFLESAQARD